MKQIDRRIIFIFLFVIVGITLILIGVLMSNNILFNNLRSEIGKEEISNDNEIDGDSVVIVPIELKLGGKRNITGAQLLQVNDYELCIPMELVEIGYSVSIDNNILTIVSNDNNYKFIMYQLTNNYIMPNEDELDNFYDSDEIKQLDEKYYDDIITSDEYDKQYENLQIEYFKKLGYKPNNSPNYVLPSIELEKLRSNYILSDEEISSGRNGIFPGDEYYTYYDWGYHKIYAIPKLEESSFGKYESDFSAYIETFEYYDDSVVNYNIDLWTI